MNLPSYKDLKRPLICSRFKTILQFSDTWQLQMRTTRLIMDLTSTCCLLVLIATRTSRSTRKPANSRIHLCALVSPIPDLGSAPEIAFDRHNRSMVSFTVRLNKQILAEQKKLEPIITLRNNSHVTIENTLMDTKIPISNLNGKDGHLSYRIKNVEFTKSEYDENIEADNSKPISLFSLSPTTGDLHMDSDVVDHPEGIYKVDIHANKKASNEYFASLVSEVHFVNPSVKLKFSFDQSRDVIGLNLGVFEQKLTDAIRSEGLGPDLSVYLDRPETYKDVEGTNVNKSTACFYVVRGNTVLSLEHSIEAISASANSESPLTRLYQVYKVINIERCTEPAPFRRMAHFFSPYTFVWIIVTLACVLILIAMFGYMCFLTKYRDYLRRKELDFATQMEKKPPVDDFTIPQYINLNINQCL
ncbi:hypothetical protein L596_005258 [Steinernema carpocapsae]|uniref:Cadherin domain-containing protein n=1 Tax=Steinernema carpocapsae TaxID=34508 RepID=A0A4U8UYP6_STECR|nr:hypothetical protein L596_005258 [Steinernema carpocapsae]